MGKVYVGKSVLQAARERVSYAFDNFPNIYLSFSGGKDSGVMMHIACEEARRRGRKVGVLIVDLEAQYKLTIDYMISMVEKYRDVIDLHWVCLPLNLRNAVSNFEPEWTCWDQNSKDKWVRQPPSCAITDSKFFPFFEKGMEFEEFVPEFGEWYGGGDLVACLVGIRTQESLNRWRTITSKTKRRWDNKGWTTWIGGGVFNLYPIYDWQTEDIWRYYGKEKMEYNRLYDYMHRAGLTIHQQRICQPYGDDQRKGLWLFHLIEPETWAKVLERVNGANQGALYANERGNILGNHKVTKPEHLTWQQYAERLLEGMPPSTREHYRDKIAVYLKWYEAKGYDDGIPDEGPANSKTEPSWTRIVKALLRNDYWCKGLSFTQTKSGNYHKYRELMQRRRREWGM